VIDGIDTIHYKTCLPFENGSLLYYIDIYFSAENWTMPGGQNAPVFLSLNVTILHCFQCLLIHRIL